MSTKSKKTKRKNVADYSSDDSDDDSDRNNGRLKRQSYAEKQTTKNSKIINNLCDTDSSSSKKESRELYRSRSNRSCAKPPGKTSFIITLSDSSNSSSAHASKSKLNPSKQKTKVMGKRKRKNLSSESSSESSEKNTNVKKKIIKSPNVMVSIPKTSSKQIHLIPERDSVSSSSKESQKPKLAKKKKLSARDSEIKELANCSSVNTPSRDNEGKTGVDPEQEITFKHHVIQELKKFRDTNNQLQEDLQLNNDYLLKKKLSTVLDAKFFVHKIVGFYDNMFSKLRETRKEFIKNYEDWLNEVNEKSKDVVNEKLQLALSSSSEESDSRAPNDKNESNNKKSVTNKVTVPSDAKLSCSVIDSDAETIKNGRLSGEQSSVSDIASPNAKTQSSTKSPSSNKSPPSIKSPLNAKSPPSNKSPLKNKSPSSTKSSQSKNDSVASRIHSSLESEPDFPAFVCPRAGSDASALSSPTKSKEGGKKPEETEKNEVAAAKEQKSAKACSDSEDMFDTSTGEIVDTSLKADSPTVISSNDEDVQAEPVVESSMPSSKLTKPVSDSKELEAYRRLMQDSTDVDSGSESDDEEEENGKQQQQLEQSGSSKAKPATREARAKFLERQTKKRNLLSSDSSSGETREEARSRRRACNKSTEASTSLRTATAPGQKGSFDPRANEYYMNDEKLRRKCEIRLQRLPRSELAKHARALEKSKNYIERKKIESLANLDSLESKAKSKKNASITPEDSASAVDNKKSSKKKSKQQEKKCVVDFLDEKSSSDSDESSDKNDDLENPVTLPTDDDPLEQSIEDAEKLAKEALLRDTSATSSSDENGEDPMEVDGDNSEKQKNKGVEDKEVSKNNDDEDNKDDEDKLDKKKDKGAWRKDKLLTFNLDGSGTEEEKMDESEEKEKEKKSESENENDKSSNRTDNSSPLKKIKKVKKTRKTRRILDSDEDAQSASEDSNADSSLEESEEEKKDKGDKKKQKRRRKQSSDSDASSGGKKGKAKRRRIKKVASESESDDKNSPGKGRKNIRKVLKDRYVTDDTRKAAIEEEERLKRIAERQRLFNEIHERRQAGEEKVDKLVLDIDKETKEELVVVDPELAKKLKPHQARGIKFMWDACYESIDQIEKSEGSGCIIAHCMGLGKTFQVVTLAHTLLTHEKTGVHTVMVVCPLSTVLNWVNEFKMWLKNVKGKEIEIFEMTKLKKNIERKCELENWRNYGGVLIIGYEMFRNLTSTGKKMRKKMQESVMQSLVDPGADLVICDEGHLLKNEDSALSKAMKLVKTMRRIVLTGTPLQNNLKEYHCMVQFVKPNLLGTKKEFLNRFVNPITNGQFDDSTPFDVKLMKKRAHVLHKMLEGSVQRYDYSVLMPFLPPKQEYVIFVRLTEVQLKMYRHYLDNFARRLGGRNVTLFADFQSLQRIWTHPYVLRLNAEKVEKANEKKRMEDSDSEGSLKDFIDDDDDSSISEISIHSSNSNSSDVECLDSDGEKVGAGVRKRGTRANPIKEEEEPAEKVEETVEEAAWWSQFVTEDQFNDLRISTKLMLLFAILKESESIGDKVLVFSQSLYSLTLIEHFLNLMDEESQADDDSERLDGHSGSWSIGVDYFRLDGSTTAENRSIWSKIFNDPKNTRGRLFLISTRAGGLGINLTGANRVIIFDASWNPSHDVQSIFRIYRFGQKKPCYVYRFLAAGTMEEKIYNRQVTKLSLSCRVVDEQQIERHYSNTDLAELYQFDTCEDQSETLSLPKDRLLAEIFIKYKKCIVKCHEHDSLLENKQEEELDEEERKQAWTEYEQERKGIRQQGYSVAGNEFAFNQMLMSMSVMPEFQGVKQLLEKDYPNVPPEHLDMLARKAMFDMYQQIEQQAALNTTNSYRDPQAMLSQNNLGSLQEAIMQQQNYSLNALGNNYPVNRMPAYSGRGRPPKYTSVNNQIVMNPLYVPIPPPSQQKQFVPNDNDIQIVDESSNSTSSSKQPAVPKKKK